MSRIGPYEVHPFADTFPLLEGAEFAELVADIKRNGLREPILLSHDKRVLIDGRNRLRACEAAGVAPKFDNLQKGYSEPSLLDLIVSKNAARRHLNPGQKAMVSLEYEKAYAAIVPKGRPIGGGAPTGSEKSSPDLDSLRPTANERKSAAMAARATGASRSAVAQAKAVMAASPELADKVKQGTVALDAAYKQVKQKERNEPRPEPVKPSKVMLALRTHDGKEVAYPQPAAKATFNETKGEGISWAAWSWNPVTGCLHGCDYCYARELATRDSYKAAYPAGFAPLFHHERLDAPANTSVPAAHRGDPAWKRVFVCSMADLYGRWVPEEWITAVHDSMLATPWWEYLLLTKFPARYVGLKVPPGAWLGTSVDEQKRVRIAEDAFRKIEGAKVKWLSLEPLREPLEFTDLSMFDWVVIGAQTETYQPTGSVPAFAPPFEWVARIVAQAREAGCRVHLKPNLLGRVSPQLPGMQLPDEYPIFENDQG